MLDYAFPIPGYTGTVELHHGSVRGGADLFAARGARVVAIAPGVVESEGWGELGGWHITYRTDDGLEVYCAHLDERSPLRAGQRFARGRFVGFVGNTGNATHTLPHLHIGIGRAIIRGAGPTGGTGGDFDAVGLLRAAFIADQTPEPPVTAQKPPIAWFPAHPTNYGPRTRPDVRYEAIVLHTTDGGRTLDDLGAWFGQQHPPGQAGSTHFGVDPQGRVGQFVSLSQMAYAHGLVRSPTAKLVADNGDLNPNLWAIGIEHLDGGVRGATTPAQLEASARLAAWLFATEILPHAARTGATVDRDHVITHSQIDGVTRAFCPSWPEARIQAYIARVKELLAGATPPPPPRDYKALYEALLRRQRDAAGAEVARFDALLAELQEG
jgi:hypothetical protein